jgi:hypothetical protein
MKKILENLSEQLGPEKSTQEEGKAKRA